MWGFPVGFLTADEEWMLSNEKCSYDLKKKYESIKFICDESYCLLRQVGPKNVIHQNRSVYVNHPFIAIPMACVYVYR